ncbi:hypothetical protein RvY_14881, partial [Ramazzottius varieornatus]
RNLSCKLCKFEKVTHEPHKSSVNFWWRVLYFAEIQPAETSTLLPSKFELIVSFTHFIILMEIP